MPGEAPDALAARLAQAKAKSLQNAHPDQIIIGSDQVASLDTQILGKPGSVDRAQQQLRQMRGRSVVFYTGLCVLDTASGNCITAMDETTVSLRALSDEEIDRYIAVDNPLDCAGSFKVEALGITLFEQIHSTDPTALIGMPLIKLGQCLRELGIKLP